ncbi:MAG: DUF4411 family protein [Burkholderiales bacterium]|nr:DUF4411 family protein [Phycisphaerae bacterium]
MPGYLLDNNHVQALYNKVPAVINRLQAIGDAQLRTSAIVLGEIDAGHRMTVTTDQAKRDEYEAWVNKMFIHHVCNITASTRKYYGEIIGKIWEKHCPNSGRTKTERHLVDALGIDVNDVWITATAWEHGLTLVTNDGMEKVRTVAEETGLKIENWIRP